MERHRHNYRKSSLANLGNIDKKAFEKPKLPKFTVANVEEFKKNKNKEIIFSFKFYDRVHKAFNLGSLNKVCDKWFVELLDCLKEVSERTWGQLVMTKKFDAHPHNFARTNFIYELFDNETLEQLDCVQFRLSKSYGRVHGFLIDNCFYIYWLDPHHNMNDSVGYPGVTKYNPIKSCHEELSEYNASLLVENGKLHQKIEYFKGKLDEDKFELLEELIVVEDRLKELNGKYEFLLHKFKDNQD